MTRANGLTNTLRSILRSARFPMTAAQLRERLRDLRQPFVDNGFTGILAQRAKAGEFISGRHGDFTTYAINPAYVRYAPQMAEHRARRLQREACTPGVVIVRQVDLQRVVRLAARCPGARTHAEEQAISALAGVMYGTEHVA